MGDKKNQSEDLNAFEAVMASLRPKADQLDRRWSERLADVTRGLCNHPAGHQYACIHCGVPAPKVRGRRRWVWPAATAAMTAAAALLLMMLAVRPARQIATNEVEQGVAATVVSVAQERTNPNLLAPSPSSGFSLAIGKRPRFSIASGPETSYLNLREQTLRFGVERWEPPVLASDVSKSTKGTPLNSRQLLDRLIKQQGLSGS